MIANKDWCAFYDKLLNVGWIIGNNNVFFFQYLPSQNSVNVRNFYFIFGVFVMFFFEQSFSAFYKDVAEMLFFAVFLHSKAFEIKFAPDFSMPEIYILSMTMLLVR